MAASRRRNARAPRGIAGFAPLAAAAGFRVVKAEQAFLSEQVLLRPL
jgi:hypothetical protein